MSVWSWLKLTVCLWLLGKAAKAAGWLAAFAAVIAAWPLTLLVAAGYLSAWWRGRPPAWLRRAAAWSLVMPLAWLSAAAARPGRLRAAALAPVRAWQHGWPYPAGPAAAREFAAVRPGDSPGRAGPGRRACGGGGTTPSPPGWAASPRPRRSPSTAGSGNGRSARPRAWPARPPRSRWRAGGTRSRSGPPSAPSGHRWDPVFTLPAAACARHMVIIGATGSGKTNLMMRLWAGWFTATLHACDAGTGDRPLLIVLDCKGGPDSRRKAGRTRRLLYGAGARRVAVWPDEARLSLWDLPGRDLAVLLYQMIDTGTGNAAYYADILQAALTLAVTAPGGPPLNSAGFLDRLEARWLTHAWSDGRHPGEVALVQAAARHLPDIQLRFATLLGRLGPALDGPGTLADADAWYFILEGTSEPSVAEAQAMALTELAAHAVTSPAARAPGRCCWPPMTTPPCPAGFRCPICTSGAGLWASASRSAPSPGRASAPMTTSGTGSRPPPTAASSSCTPRIPSR